MNQQDFFLQCKTRYNIDNEKTNAIVTRAISIARKIVAYAAAFNRNCNGWHWLHFRQSGIDVQCSVHIHDNVYIDTFKF